MKKFGRLNIAMTVGSIFFALLGSTSAFAYYDPKGGDPDAAAEAGSTDVQECAYPDGRCYKHRSRARVTDDFHGDIRKVDCVLDKECKLKAGAGSSDTTS